ncbi:response regulator [Tateyamaria sp.]|uniref:response regulator n=1 Tax=Tateyamaria sp. TaxID=1929288 RepID=UPI0032A0827A
MSDQLHFLATFWSKINRVRVYIFLGMLLVVSVPLILLMQKSYDLAYQRELNKVEQSHLVIADNLASTLQRYATDLEATFDFVVANHNHAHARGSMERLLGTYSFRMVAEFRSGNETGDILYAREFAPPSKAVLGSLRRSTVSDSSTFSGVQQSPDGPVIYVTRLSRSGSFLVGAIDTSFLIAQQADITFGERGHAMIVDHKGRVMAHPKKEWVETAKDASGLEVVQRMTSGRTGVMQFYAPPLKADVIAGYTSVPSTGWGAMVPQPISELEDAASVEATSIIHILLLLFLLAALASWVLSGLIARPIHNLSQVVTEVRAGNLSARVPEFSPLTPRELISLRSVFNGLLDSWSDNRVLLENSLDAANEANMRKSKAISVLSHEMRTPLNGVVGAVDLLEQTELTDLQKKYLGFVDTSSNTLLNHVNNVLEVSRLDSAKVKLKKDRIGLAELMRDIVHENSAQAEHTGSKITLNFAPDMPLSVETDAGLLRKIAANLVGNAVKFVPDGQIDVLLGFEPNGILELVVKDNGPGINACDIERAFEPFTVLDASYGRNSEGTGLGLSIVAMSVEALGGQITVNSEVGAGCEFRVRIPVATVEKCTQLAAENKVTKRLPQNYLKQVDLAERMHVLVVDDNEINRLVLTEMLQRLGQNVSIATDGPGALEAAMTERFDLILMDISMPGMDGTEVARLLRDLDGPNRSAKIIAQTAHTSPEDRDKIFAAKMQGIFTKPVSLETLRTTLNGIETGNGLVRFDDEEIQSVLEWEPLQILVSARGLGATDRSLDELFDEASLIINRLKSCAPLHLDDDTVISRVHNTSGACATLGANLLHSIFSKIENCLKSGSMSSSRDLLEAAERAIVTTRNASSNMLSQLKYA